jgi:hypothetical protein
VKFLENFKLVFQKIDPCKFAKIINKTHIIFFHPTDSGAGPRHQKTQVPKETEKH